MRFTYHPLSSAIAALGMLLAAGAPLSAQDISPSPPDDALSRETTCLATAILFEAGSEPLEGQLAVAEVILNRLKSPAFPKTICSVVYQGSERRTGCQFSFTCDGSLNRKLPVRLAEQAHAVAEVALGTGLTPRLDGATHYHAAYVSPNWAPSLVRVARIGQHIFYRMPSMKGISPADPLRQVAMEAAYRFAPWGLNPDQHAKE